MANPDVPDSGESRLEEGLSRDGSRSSGSTQTEQDSLGPSLQESEQEEHQRDQALLGATLRANVFNPELLSVVSGQVSCITSTDKRIWYLGSWSGLDHPRNRHMLWTCISSLC
jgi:hypothetical protein